MDIGSNSGTVVQLQHCHDVVPAVYVAVKLSDRHEDMLDTGACSMIGDQRNAEICL